jgi:hypothetical protein
MISCESVKQIKTRLLIPTLFMTVLAGHPFPQARAAETCDEWIVKVVSVQGSVQV